MSSNAKDAAAGVVIGPLLAAAGVALAGWGIYELFPRDVVHADASCAR